MNQRRREAHGQSVMNGFVVFLRARGVFAVSRLSSIVHGVIVNFARSHRGPQTKFEPSPGEEVTCGNKLKYQDLCRHSAKTERTAVAFSGSLS